MLAVNLSANSLAQRTKVVKPKTCRQLVINGDITLLTQFLDADLKYRRLAGQMCRLVIIRKIDSDVTCLAGLYPNQTFFEPGNKAARSQFQRMTLGRTTFKSLAIDASDEINKDNVAVFGSARLADFHSWPVGIGNIVQRFVNFSVTGFKDRLFNLEGRQIRHADFGHHLAGQCRLEILAFFIGLDIDARLAGKAQLIIFNRLAGALIKGIFQGLALHLRSKA